MSGKAGIEIIHPKPYQRIRAEFILRGRIQEDCLKIDQQIDWSVLGGLVDINGFEFSSMIYADVRPGWFSKFTKKHDFLTKVRLNQFNVPFIQESRGRIALKLGARKECCTVFLPLIVDGFEPGDGESLGIAEKHSKIGETIMQYERDLEEYYKELKEIELSRKIKDDGKVLHHMQGENIQIASDILKILEQSEDSFDTYAYTEEDRREQELSEKYKDALSWRGPLLRGLVSQFGGFELRVHSDDHDRHFHVIHKGKGINARFSFPELQLLNYATSRTTISSRQEQKIREYCRRPEILHKMEREFAKRGH